VRWFAKYEGRSENSSKQGKCIDFKFFDSLEDAEAFCEKHAQSPDVAS
jgi:viroplasmin and RNaseH domain-containing protein